MEDFFKIMMSRNTPIKYLHCENSGEYQSKFQKGCEKEKVNLEYTTTHMTQLNGFIEIIFAVIRYGALAMRHNDK